MGEESESVKAWFEKDEKDNRWLPFKPDKNKNTSVHRDWAYAEH